MMDLDLGGKVMLVTAASRGIGRAVAQRLASEGARVIAASRSGEASEGIDGLRLDLSNAAAVEDLYPALVERYGRIDGVFVNTPGPVLKPLLDTATPEWAQAYDLLLRPALQLSLGAARIMRAQGSGSIVFLTSSWVKQPMAKGGFSAIMRSGVSALAKQLALELAGDGIRVNHLIPGVVATDRMASILATKAAANGTTVEFEGEEAARAIPLGRWGQAHEIAAAAAFLLSPLSAYTTGASLQVDGGAIRSIH